jgi:hypothetical protein
MEHMLESADANRQIDRLIRNSIQLLGIIDFERQIDLRMRAPKTSACQFDHARRDINPDPASHLRSEGAEVMTSAAAKV